MHKLSESFIRGLPFASTPSHCCDSFRSSGKLVAKAKVLPEIDSKIAEEHRKLSLSVPRRPAPQQGIAATLLGNLGLLQWPGSSEAALVQFPTTSLRNNYFLVRAGESEAEAEGFVLTNPVSKTSMSSGLSPIGRRQVVRELVPKLEQMGACSEGCWIWPSICQRSYQTAELIASILGLGQNRIIPEYSFLDARGLGSLEGLRVESALRQVAEGDSASPEWRPPRGYDGTPNESVYDVLVRVRQVLSITETQYRNTDIVIVAPDSDNLTVLQAALLGLDLRSHHQLQFQPGEARMLQLSETEEPGKFSNSTLRCPNPPRCTL